MDKAYLMKAINCIQFLADEKEIDQDNGRGMISYICEIVSDKIKKEVEKTAK